MRLFSDQEYLARIEKVRRKMQEKSLDACLITSPENILYLSGLDHQGFFAYQALIIPIDKDPVIIARAMESAIINDLVLPIYKFYPYSDTDQPLTEILDLTEQTQLPIDIDNSSPVQITCKALNDLGLSQANVAFEKNSPFLTYKLAEGFIHHMKQIKWSDLGDLVNDCRLTQSESEIAMTRKTAMISDGMIMAAYAAAGSGIPVRDIAAQVYLTMVQRGSSYPPYAPFIRSSENIHHEHGTWGNAILKHQDVLFLEMSGCIDRYNAPMGRFIHIGGYTDDDVKANDICQRAHFAAAEVLKPGALADTVYQAWQETINQAGLSHYQRHHCGYAVGIGFPPSWSGAGVPRGLRKGSTMKIKKGMVFHLMSWLMGTGVGNAFMSDTVVVQDEGCEFLTVSDRNLLFKM